MLEVSDTSMGQDNTEFLNSFPFNDLSTKVNEDNLVALLYTAGNVALKSRSYNDST